jgi:phosphopantothenoylcysteine decarboxylase/phosphopantothenate--cysteine ligase
MFDISLKLFKKTDIAIMSAAVADYTPVEVANQKIKRKRIN